MTDKVQLIKKEIERKLKDVVGAYESEDTEHGYKQCCKEILSFIDSLPEEPASEDRINECPRWDKDWGCETSPMNNCDSCPYAKWVEVKEEKKNCNEQYKRIAQTEQFKKSYCYKSLGKEEPGCEVNFTTKDVDLEEELTKYIKSKFTIDKEQLDRFGIKPEDYTFSLDKRDLMAIARHFAEWQKAQDEKIVFAETKQSKSWQRIYKKAHDDVKKEMMKDAVETTIVNDWQYGKDPDHAVIPAIHQELKDLMLVTK